MSEVGFDDLCSADLIVETTYKGGNKGHVGDDPISKLLACGNQGGFRYKGNVKKFKLNYVVLYSSMMDLNWPDELDNQTGLFTYFGDNKSPGVRMHETAKKGNLILKNSFRNLHKGNRINIPPFFIFAKGAIGRDVIFKGLAVPGAVNLTAFEDLVAVWKVNDDRRFQNYKAVFTTLAVEFISRAWINNLEDGDVLTDNTPDVYKVWINTGEYEPLKAKKTIKHRSKASQMPDDYGIKIIETILDHFKDDPYKFENFAAKVLQLMDQNFIEYDLTRPTKDGGRDAIGYYRVGSKDEHILIDFAMEAKRYNINNAIGVKETSRLISRIRHRQFGVLVTTSYVHQDAYKEIKEDEHPVVIISAKDIVNILSNKGMNTVESVNYYLQANFRLEL